ncbi:MAG: rhomboid family intramembrane serine protease [archaeon]|nr:rhomboid family intramembrane serine protease [archaeon]
MSYAISIEEIKNARLTQILMGINIICFIFFNIVIGDSSIFYFFIQNNPLILNGEIWRIYTLFTSIFMHGDLSHLISNMLGLLIFGSTIEKLFSKIYYLTTYILSGIIGSIFSLILSPSSIGLGASGAIFGLMGAVFIILSRENKIVLIYGIIYIAISISNSFLPGIGTWAHIFGLLGGFMFGYLFIKRDQGLFNKERNRPKYT